MSEKVANSELPGALHENAVKSTSRDRIDKLTCGAVRKKRKVPSGVVHHAPMHGNCDVLYVLANTDLLERSYASRTECKVNGSSFIQIAFSQIITPLENSYAISSPDQIDG
jgi:hypothetical protein